MATPGAILVPCPQCGEAIEIAINTTGEYINGVGMTLKLAPDVNKMAEHYATAHGCD